MSMGCRWPNDLTLDAKQRVPVPPPYRSRAVEQGDEDEGIATFYVGREKDPCLYMHSRAQHAAYLRELEELLGGDSVASRNLMRVIRGSFVKVRCDSQGRLTLNETLRKQGGIDRTVTMVDMVSRVEIWDSAAFAALRDKAESDGLFDLLDELRREREQRIRSNSGQPARPAGEGGC